MKTRPLGRTGIDVSEIGFGCGTTADLMIHGTPRERRSAVARALELGINYFDTAPVYGDGVSETNLGLALHDLSAAPIVATKVALSAADFDDIEGNVIRSVEASLKRLRLDHIPVIQLHNRVGSVRAAKAAFGSGALLTVEDVLGAGGVVAGLEELRQRGLAAHFGCSAYGGDMKCGARLIASSAFDLLMANYSLLNQTAWHDSGVKADGDSQPDYAGIGGLAAAAGMGVIALRVLEGGLLADWAAAPATSRPGPGYVEMAARIQDLRGDTGLADNVAETAVRFALANDQISTVLLGFSDLGQIEDAAGWAEAGPLSPNELSSISTALGVQSSPSR